jgi:dipeptidyl aminopeptidase/acylaminoacyl peptidase
VSKIFITALISTVALAMPMTAQAQNEAATPTIVVNAATRLPISVFGLQPFMRSPRISPDGTKVAVQLARGGKGFLGIIDLTKPGSAPEFFLPTNEVRDVGDRTVGQYRWVGNDTVVVTLASRENIFGQRGDKTRLIAYSLTTKKMTPLAWDDAFFSAANILHIDHDKGTLLLQRQSNAYSTELIQSPEVVNVDVRTGKFTIVQRPNPIVDSWIVDSDGVVRAAAASASTSESSGKEKTLYRSNTSQAFRTVQNAADASFTGSLPQPEFIPAGSDIVIGSSNKDNYRRLYKLDMNTMALGEMIFEKPGYDVTGVLTDWSRKKVIGYSYTDTRDRVTYIDNDWKTIQALMDEQFGAGNASAVSMDKKEEKIIFLVAKPSQPGGFYLFNTVSGQLQLIGWVHPTIKDGTVNSMSTVVYTARDGMKIPAVVTMPRHRKGQKNLPVVILPHGGPYGVRQIEEFGYFPWHQALAEQGYVVVEPNYRGSGGYGRDFVKAGRKPDSYGKVMQDDLNDALAWFAKDGTVDAKRACIMGWSYGGYAAARGAQRDGSLWRCSIAGAGVYDMKMMNRWDAENLSTFSSKFQATSSDPDGISSAQNTGGKWAPILIVAGLRDQRIPIEQSRTLVARLKASGKVEGTDYRYVEQPQGTHNLPYEDVHIQFLEETNKWLDRFNPAYIASDKDKAPPMAVVPNLPKQASVNAATPG